MNLSQSEKDRCETFLVLFNQIEEHLRIVLHQDDNTSFNTMMNRYIDQHKSWGRDRHTLNKIAKLRNILVHDRVSSYKFVAIPTEETISQANFFRDRLINPQKVIPTFQRNVETLTSEEKLSTVLRKINDCDYSQFPVSNGNQFFGLLTENGITRWLAHHTSCQYSTVDFEEQLVSQILAEEEKRSNYTFVSRETLVDEIVEQFSSNLFLEAALITHNGHENEKLLGIATRWDILHQLQ